MEQAAAQYWTWMRREFLLKSHFRVPADSWEEKAFAEDAASGLGGCVWPPRSYSCSFCRKEFRSAQALGGHMNVHRRDRARLKQNDDVFHSLRSSDQPKFPNKKFCNISGNIISKIPDSCVDKVDSVETSLSVGFSNSSVFCRDRTGLGCGEEEDRFSKRTRSGFPNPPPPPPPTFVPRDPLLSLKPNNSLEELDLELRLGDGRLVGSKICS